jgi:hypothetical protein
MSKPVVVAILAILIISCPAFGDCTFGFLSEITTDAGANAGDVASGDFNHDGLVDFAVVNRQSDKIAIILGQNGGTFADPVLVSQGGAYNQAEIEAADITGDGHLDLLVMGGKQVYENTTFSEMWAQVLEGDGAGGFSIGDQEWIGFHPDDIAAGDYDKDGDIDFAVSRTGNNPPGFHMIVNLGGGDIAQKSENQITTGGWIRAIAGADFDGDGNLDVAMSDASNKKVWLFFGIGDGTFTRSDSAIITTSDSRQGAGPMVAADFNGDGYADIAVGNMITGSYLPEETVPTPEFVVALSNGANRTFGTPVVRGSVWSAMKAETADVNGDGKADVVFALSSSIRVYLGAGDGTFTTHDYGTGGLGLEFADVDKDGGLDIATTHFSQGTVGILQNTCGQVTLTLTSSANPAYQGNNLTVTAGLTANPPTATGTWTLSRTGYGTITSSTAPMETLSVFQYLPNGTHEYVLTYTGDSRFKAATKTLIQTVQLAPFGPPVSFHANSSAGSNGIPWLAWFINQDTQKYEVWRRTATTPYAKIGEGTPTPGLEYMYYNDYAVPAASAVEYKVRAVRSGDGVLSDFSAPDFTLSGVFTNDPVTAQVTPIRNIQLVEVREAANKLRSLAGLAPRGWTNSTIMLASQFTELLAAINEARTQLGAAPAAFWYPVSPGQPIRATALENLRDAMR